MPRIPNRTFGDKTPHQLMELAIKRASLFCYRNDVPLPVIIDIPRGRWHVNACAYYRPEGGIKVCIPLCVTRLAGEVRSRNWNWPGSTTDREPYGVIAHELGHHCDWYASEKKGSYFGDYGVSVFKESGEKPITSYCPNPAEWFAEMFRLFVTNPNLLEQLRPKTYEILCSRWKPVGSMSWVKELGEDVPNRIYDNLVKKIERA